MDDARFETIVVKQTKQSVLEEARQLANGKITAKRGTTRMGGPGGRSYRGRASLSTRIVERFSFFYGSASHVDVCYFLSRFP